MGGIHLRGDGRVAPPGASLMSAGGAAVAGIVACLTVLGVTGCGGRAAPGPPSPGEPTRRPEPGPARSLGPCPPPLTFGSGPRPRGIRVSNRTGEAVMVFIDRCRGHERVADVRSGETRLFRLPELLVETGGGLTFHTFLRDTYRYHSTVTLPVDTVPVLELEVADREEEDCDPVVYLNGERWAGAIAEIPGIITAVTVREPSRPGQCRVYLFEAR